MAPKGKTGTKGQKQIFEENQSTLKFYLGIILCSNTIFLIFMFFLFWESFTLFYQFLFLTTSLIYGGVYHTMSRMAQAVHTPDGALIDAGMDLNISDGMSEHMKDLIIFLSIVQLLSLISNYFWFLLILIPGRAFHILWVNFLGPWFFAEQPETNEKKAKKLERKMKRQN